MSLSSPPKHEHLSHAALARSLAKLWPNRLHESNWFKNLLCYLGLHRWARLNLEPLPPDQKKLGIVAGART